MTSMDDQDRLKTLLRSNSMRTNQSMNPSQCYFKKCWKARNYLKTTNRSILINNWQGLTFQVSFKTEPKTRWQSLKNNQRFKTRQKILRRKLLSQASVLWRNLKIEPYHKNRRLWSNNVIGTFFLPSPFSNKDVTKTIIKYHS